MELAWRINLNLAAIHAAWCTARWPQEDLKLPRSFSTAAAGLVSACSDINEQRDCFWDSLLQIAPDFDDSNELASRIAEEFFCDSDENTNVVPGLSRSILDVQQSFRNCYPNFDSEVRWRMNPIRDLWEAYGPGLLHSMYKLTGVPKPADRCEIFAVLPHRGGVGYAHLMNNRLHLELLLTNRHPRIPETLHLAWLIAKANQFASFGQNLAISHTQRLAAKLGWIPATFAAAEDLDVSELNPSLVAKAIELWWISHNCESNELAELLVNWWRTSTAQSLEWNERLLTLSNTLSNIEQVDSVE